MMVVLNVIVSSVIILIVMAPTAIFVLFFMMAVPSVVMSSVIILIVMAPKAFLSHFL